MRVSPSAAAVAASIVVGGLPLAACRNAAPPSPAAAPPPAAAAPAAAPAPASTRPALTGAYEAISTTAMGISGDLTLGPRALTFKLGLVYDTERLPDVPAGDDYGHAADSWADLLGVPATSVVELRRVTKETVGPKARNGGLCAPETVTFLALGTAAMEGHQPSIKMAAFKGETMPGPQASATDLCGTFNYGPKP